MRTDTPVPTRLQDYTPPAWLVETVHLTFRLDPEATVVRSEIRFVPGAGGDLHLDGQALRLLSASINGEAIRPDLHECGLTVLEEQLPDGPFTWVAETRINPQANTALEGLYMSNGMYCTQCEAEGFRRITYFPDRPDVMAVYTVRIEGAEPVMLSNGNPAGSGEGWAEWHDPWPKPSYLFALVAGDLRSVEDSFTTRSGRDVDLRIWVRDGDQDRCAYAMDSLKRSMKWDEEVYGREYDLDLFQIVAVDDFNAGAMENKGLNIFNSKYVLASPETATDGDFEGIESVIAHEYFHNWTGNRITCRDWFQLSLKEGLTVFRDQQFSADMRSEPVKRIDDVLRLRAAQFREDAGPLAHPVRPAEYIEINNFYTATVYEKGAELIRMLREIVGAEGYAKALDLYFERHDGEAATIEDWLKVFEDATGHDLTQFKRWYEQAGTPRVHVAEQFEDGRFTLTFRQETPPTPGQPEKAPVPIPIRWGLLGAQGEVAAGTFVLDKAQDSLIVEVPERPVPSLLRGFSAPVILMHEGAPGDRAARLARDTDPFNRWEAGRSLALDTLVQGADPQDWLDGTIAVAMDETLDPTFRALALGLPSEDEIARQIAETGRSVDPDAVRADRIGLDRKLAEALGPRAAELRAAMATPGPYSPDGDAPGKRELANRMLGLMTRLDPTAPEAPFADATNMTDRLTALALLVREGRGEAALAEFHAQWQHLPGVVDKWFAVQAGQAAPDRAVEVVTALTEHPDFNWKTPNRFRALVGGFAGGNPAGFHRVDGAGYRFVADWLIRLDKLNPMTAARLSGVFETWRRYDDTRQDLMEAELERIASTDGLSRDTAEMIGRIRAA
ncbi:aminopeptidase N [Pontivivens ytuae]|uniref:Aminopeptidase N n=1 Tax=Pontivivens ytuae TaxID=2789856 RepID=A0A7S9LSX7_9RHOB|nr:aminopeptidase N [Pontivivens ytuae]QPH54551.1 aminopeptidase N [Pontivivens ytuae]